MLTARRNGPLQSIARWLANPKRLLSSTCMPFKSVVSALIAAALMGVAPACAVAREALTLTRADGQPVAAMVYRPQRPVCRGIAMISPGAGGSEQGYAYLGEGLSSLGYLALVMGHPESGRQALREYVQRKGLREGLGELITSTRAYQGRFMDIDAARQWARAHCEGREQVLVGHSMGAATVMIEAGARNSMGLSAADAFDAYIALSPQGQGAIFPADAWSGIGRPVLLVTGTQDTELGGGSWQTRTEPFAKMPAGCKQLAVIEGATHMHLAGIGASQHAEMLTTRVISAFLDGVRRGDCSVGPPHDGLELKAK
jgi:alpha-beta hydrolase superfamily lysophospholipase